jgi:ribonuclease HI
MLVEAYSDGSGTSFGKPGGYGVVIVVDGVKVHEFSGREANATNNTMELSGAIEALKYVDSVPAYKGADIVLISDSQLALNFAKGTWKCKKMHLALLANNLHVIYTKLNATTRWVKGHDGSPMNERCDALAKAARENTAP